jgi:hypothetical protein
MPHVSSISPQNIANLIHALGKIAVLIPYGNAGVLTSLMERKARYMTAKQLSCAAQGVCRARGFKTWQQTKIMRDIAEAMLPIIDDGAADAQEVRPAALTDQI